MVMDLLGGNTHSKRHDSLAAVQLTHPNNDSIAPWLLENFVHTLLPTSFKLNTALKYLLCCHWSRVCSIHVS